MPRMKRLRLNIAMTVGWWLGVPLTVHQKYFIGAKK